MNESSPRIVLVGFMGAGKSTVGRRIARRLGCRLTDTDEVILKHTGRTARQIIDEDGEAAFRLLETETLRDIVRRESRGVIATGGGTWTFDRNRELVAEHGFRAVWLDAPFELCWRRIDTGDGSRPFARDRERARKLYEERRASYQLADFRIEVGEAQSPDQITFEVLYALGRAGIDLQREVSR